VGVLAGLLAGIPWLLWHLAGWPLPTQVPTSGEVSAFLGRPMGQDVIGNGLACLAWLVWAAFATETLLAAVRALTQIRAGAYATGSAHPLPRTSPTPVGGYFAGSGNRASARLAATLISAVILAVMSVRPTGALTLTPQRVAPVSALINPSAPPAISNSDQEPATSSPRVQHENAEPEQDRGTRSVIVRKPHGREHDSLWRIAERELGSHRRWHEIYDLNVGREQPDGQRLHDPDLIYPGWILRLPTHASRSATADPDTPRPAPPVEDGHATSPTPAPTAGTPVPQTPRPSPDASPTRTPAQQPTASPTAPASVVPTQPGPTRAPASPSATSPGTPAASPEPPSSSAPPATTSPAAFPSPPTSEAKPGRHQRLDLPVHGIDLPSGGYVGLGLAAALSTVVAMARARRRRRTAQNEALTFRLPLASPAEQPLPAVVQVLQRAHLTAITTDPAEDPDGDAPAEADPGILETTGAPAPVRELPVPVQAPPAPEVPEYGPIAIGVDDGQPLLLDLPGGSGLGLPGPGGDGVARALVTAALTRVRRPRSAPSVNIILPHADALRLFGPEVAADPPPLFTVVTDLEHALDRLEVDMLARRRQYQPHPDDEPAPDATDDQDPAQTSPTPDGQAPLLLLVATPDDPAQFRLDAILTLGRNVNVSAILLGPWPTGRTYDVDASGHVVDHPGTRLFTLTPDDTHDIVDIIRDAFSPSPPSGPLASPQRPDTVASGNEPAGGARGPSRAPLRLLPPDAAGMPRPAGAAQHAGALQIITPIPPTPETAGAAEKQIPETVSPTTPTAVAAPGDAPQGLVPTAPAIQRAENLLQEQEFTTGQPATTPASEPDSVAAKPASTALEVAATFPAAAQPAGSPAEALTAAPTEVAAQAEPVPAPPDVATKTEGVLQEWRDSASTGPWSAPINVRVLGQLRLLAAGEEVRHGLRGKTQELLLFVLLNPAGVSSEAVADALWPATTQSASALRSSMKRLRAQLRNVTGMGEQMFIVFASGRYRPDRRIMACDAWQFEAATRAATDVPTASTPPALSSPARTALAAAANPEPRIEAESALDAQRLSALREAVALYGGTLLDGFDYPWLEPYRQALRHHALHVFVRFAAAIAATDPESALAALERALPIDPVNETLYRRVMRLQARLGRPEAIAGTLALLRRQLDEIDERPERQTLTLAATLSSRDQGPDDA
jgi:DNA-binding SARP family transcriptional activator